MYDTVSLPLSHLCRYSSLGKSRNYLPKVTALLTNAKFLIDPHLLDHQIW